MKKRKEDWIKITKPDGRNFIAAPSYISELLGVDKNEAAIYTNKFRLRLLEKRVHVLESPARQQTVIELLTEQAGKSRSFVWLKNRVLNLDYRDMRKMVMSEVLKVEMSGTNNMYYLKGARK